MGAMRLAAVLAATFLPAVLAAYDVGVGIADVTGPPNEVTFMGYAQMGQIGNGVHLRQFARSFITNDGEKSFVFISVDCGMIGNGLRRDVIESLERLYGDLYSETNVMISGTHTHSAPGGYLLELLFDLSTLGFVKETYAALVEGIVLSVDRAHKNMQKGRVFVVTGELLDVSVNRSPLAYLANPEQERNKYVHNVDKTMVQMRFVSMDDKPLGVINWYAVHATSMNNTNRLVSSDNLGYAAIHFEERMNPSSSLPGKGPFVAAFASSNEGDVTPNTREPRCQRSGRPCNSLSSACPTRRDQCVASGPGNNMYESTRIIGTRLADKAWEMWGSDKAVEMTGPVRSIHQFVDMPNERASTVDPETGRTITVKGCSPAMGYSFAAGTTDGPGAFNFEQGMTAANPLWNAVRDLLAEPSPEDVECHGAKPILINTGSMKFPLEWQPHIVSTQLAKVGDLVIACVPGEFTTMAGRRLRNAVRDAFIEAGAPDSTQVVIAGLCNTYTDYVVTPEEYQVQRYEGASTIFGPHTLTLYLAQYRRLAEAMHSNAKSYDPGPAPRALLQDVVSLQPPVVYDWPKWNHDYGDVLLEPPEKVAPGQTVKVIFVSGNPRNNMQPGATYLTVERYDADKNYWYIYKTDAHWETKFIWERTSTVFGMSQVIVLWEVALDTPCGTFRVRHFGHYKYMFTGRLHKYEGASRNFTVSCLSRYRYGSGRRIRGLT